MCILSIELEFQIRSPVITFKNYSSTRNTPLLPIILRLLLLLLLVVGVPVRVVHQRLQLFPPHRLPPVLPRAEEEFCLSILDFSPTDLARHCFAQFLRSRSTAL